MNTKRFLYGFSIFMILIGFTYEPSLTIFIHLSNIIAGKDGLITDYFIKGSVGSAFLNAGLIGLITTSLLSKAQSSFMGIDFASVFLAIGFALFGKNIFNVWPIFLGGFIYTKVNHLDFKNTWPITFFATSLAPLISEIIFVFNIPLISRIILALLLGILTGYTVHLLAPQTKLIHKGYNLYNIGLAIGIIGTIIVSTLRLFNADINPHLVWDESLHLKLYIIFGIFAVVCILYSYIKDKSFKHYKELLKTSGRNSDYIVSFSLNTVFMNIGFNILLTLLFMFILKIPLNGPMLGGLLTVIGFSSSGKHIKNLYPIYLTILLGQALSLWDTSNPSIALTAIFLTGLAPVVGTFGIIPGMIFTLVNLSVAKNTGALHGGLNLYNTGFSIGTTALFMIPFYENIFKDKIKS